MKLVQKQLSDLGGEEGPGVTLAGGKDLIERVRELKRRQEELKAEEKKAEREGALHRVAEIRYGELRECEGRPVPGPE
jgi:ATP-dependent Clp protease ATP-binding subunit ClpB